MKEKRARIIRETTSFIENSLKKFKTHSFSIRACTPICHTCFTSRYPPQLSSILSIPIFLNLARHYTLYTKNELQNLRETSPHHFRVGIFICGHFPSFDKIVSVHT